MTITLKIDNLDSLPDGGPVRFQARNRGFEIGRDQHLDWTLPDPSRYVSGRHCEVRFEEGAYWLYDVSSNGTYLNGSMQRMKSPYQLVDGDRLAIGNYIIAVEVNLPQQEQEAQERYSQPPPPASGDNIWDVGGDVPSPVDRREFMPPPDRRRAADFSEQFLDFPSMTPAPMPPVVPGASPFDLPAEAPEAFTAAPQRFTTPPVAPRPADMPSAQELPRFTAAPIPAFSPPPEPAPTGAAQDYAPTPAPQSPFGPAAAGPAIAGEGFPAPRAAPVPEFVPTPTTPPIAAPRDVPASPFGVSSPPAMPAEAPMFAPVRPMPQGAPPVAPRPADGGSRAFIQALAAGAGVSPDAFGNRDPNQIAYEVGEFVKAVVDNLAQLLRARAAAKTMAKSSSRTMISAADNNPLKFIPVSAEAIDIMFARRRPGYLDARRSVEEGFEDLKRHELATYTAMQKALGKLLDDFSPEKIEAKVGTSTFSSKKARAWDLFVRRWEERSVTDNGLLDVFLAHFAEAYDEASRKK
jgi:type VI secretion system protein ImpI